MNAKRTVLPMIISLVLIASLLLAGCGAGGAAQPTQPPAQTATPTKPPYVLKCEIGLEKYAITIDGENGESSTQMENETTSYGYTPEGQQETLTLALNRTLTYTGSGHVYQIRGKIVLNLLQNSVAYDITASGGGFGDAPQTCQGGDLGAASPEQPGAAQAADSGQAVVEPSAVVEATPTYQSPLLISLASPAGAAPTLGVPFCDQAVQAGQIAGNTYLCMASEGGDFIGNGQNWLQVPDQATISAESWASSGNPSAAVTVKVKTAEGAWELTFAPPSDPGWGAGLFENAVRYPFQEPTQPGLSISGFGRGCNELSGKFEILEMEYIGSPDGSMPGLLSRFAANFEQHCDGGPALLGYIRVDASQP